MLSIKEWLVVIVLGFVVVSTAKADEMMECIAKGRAAMVMVMGVASGVPLDQVNVYFRVGNQMITDEKYVNGIREEVRPLLGVVPAVDTPEAEPYANAIGNKIAEACAYEYGIKRGTFKRMTWKPVNIDRCGGAAEHMGSAHPNDPAASSESLKGPPIGMEEACNNLRFDIMRIGKAISDGVPMEQLKSFAQRSLPQLGEERLARILSMIDSAYAHKGPFIEWMQAQYASCKGDRI
jgi:hypothetical protein